MVARVAVSANLLTSIAVARMVLGRQVEVVVQGLESTTLAGMPIAVLQPTEAQAETFVAWGLRTVGELAALDETELVVRMGQEGGWLWRLARGCAEHLMVPVEAGLVLKEVIEFDAAVEGMESLMFVLGPMLDQLIARAGQRALALASVTLTLGLDGHSAEGEMRPGPGGEHVRVLKPALPVADRRLFLKLLHLDLEAHPPGAGVVRVQVTAEAGGRSALQTGLFQPQMPESGQLEVTLARLAGLVGEQWVGRARLRDSHAPESFVMERFRLPEEAERKREGRGRSRKDRLAWQMQELERRRSRAALDEGAGANEGDRTRNVTNIVITAEAHRGAPEQALGCEGTEGTRSKVLRFWTLQPGALETDEREGRALEEGSDASVEVGGSVERPRAVALRRMRPSVPIRWRGAEESEFWMQGVLYEVRERYGPWRRSGAWWTGEVWSKEEWDVTVEAGGGVRLLCVLTHDLLRDRWQMDAMYD